MNSTILIIGDSPFLGEIEGQIHYVLEKYPSIGINNAIRKYNVQMHGFQDAKFINLTNQYQNVKTVTLYLYGDMIQKDKKEQYDSYPFKFGENTEKDIFYNGRLAWCGFTHDFLISYCIMKGYENIVLIGAADFTGNKHYLTDEEFKYSEKLKFQSKRFIEEVCTKRANIFTCNPNSILKIPRISLTALLNTNFGS
jgi:hypothetical protein